jgi:hypothetical protein
METTFSFSFDDSDYTFLATSVKVKEYLDLLALENVIFDINSISRLIRSDVYKKHPNIVSGDSVAEGKLFFKRRFVLTGSEYAEGKLIFYVR